MPKQRVCNHCDKRIDSKKHRANQHEHCRRGLLQAHAANSQYVTCSPYVGFTAGRDTPQRQQFRSNAQLYARVRPVMQTYSCVVEPASLWFSFPLYRPSLTLTHAPAAGIDALVHAAVRERALSSLLELMVVISWRLCRSVRRLNWVTRNELLHLCLQRRLRHLCKRAPFLLMRYCRQPAVLSVAVPGWMPVG